MSFPQKNCLGFEIELHSYRDSTFSDEVLEHVVLNQGAVKKCISMEFLPIFYLGLPSNFQITN